MHDCALFKRKNAKWTWIIGGKIQRYPRVGENVVVAYNKNKFEYTSAMTNVVSVEDDGENALDIVFQDKDALWKLTFPAHTNDLDGIKKVLAESKG